MSSLLRSSIHSVLVGATMTATVAAADPQSADTSEISEVVIVTGSYIRGTPEDAALPVDVISSEELEKQGTPSTLEMLKSLTVMNGIVGESNQFIAGAGQAAEGSASINLRGLGAARTLVLLNGKRMATEDANLLPSNAIARVEVLKDGAAATYGSDAIGGVVNFITKERVDGLDLSADYRYIDDSDGDYNVGLSWGASGERSDFFVAANYFHRSQLLIRDRDWALTDYSRNPQGGWSTGANPGSFRLAQAVSPFIAPQVADPACAAFGGVLTNSATAQPSATGNQCRTQFTPWDNLVEEQDSYQLFTQYNMDIGDSTSLHLEGLYAYTDVPHANTTPSYTTTKRITSTVYGSTIALDPSYSPSQSPFFFVPAANPGFAAFVADAYPGGPPPATYGAFITINQYRPFFAGGNPLFGYGEAFTTRERQQSRFSAELTGQIGSVGWLTSATYGRAIVERQEYDISTGKLALALRGLGGEGCNPGFGTPAFALGTPGVGACQWLNPFSNGVPGSPLTGFQNPDFIASAENTAALVDWITDRHQTKSTGEVAELNVVFNGEMPFSLAGGNIGWAAGAQYRHGWDKQVYNNIASSTANPCPDTPINGSTECTPFPESPYTFLATYNDIDVDRGVYAVFGEVNLPITDSFNAQIAARFEDYGNKGGNSFDPKLALRWQPVDFLAFRGSIGTTFRAPALRSLIPDERIGFSNVLGSNRPVGSTGNPDLEPEEATTMGVGVLLDFGNFRASVDYWRFDLEKVLTNEPLQGVLDIVFPNGAAGADNCATADAAFVAAHFDFSGACAADNITKVKLLQINGAGIVNDGIDVALSYTFDNVFGGSLTLGGSGTWIKKYETETLIVNGVVFEEGFDGVGLFSSGLTAPPLPEWRSQAYLDFGFGDSSLRWTSNFVDQYRDQRTSIFTALSPEGQLIDSSIIHNVTYRVSLPWDTALLATIENITDEDPSFARTEINYDPLTGNPLGRTFKIGLRKQF